MDPLAAGYYAAAILAVGFGWEVVRRRADHWPAAALFTYGLGSDAARRLLQRAAGYYGTGALEGWARVGFKVDQALFLGWYAGVAAVAVAVFLRRRPWIVLLGWMAVVAALLPHERGLSLANKYRVVEFAALALGIASAFAGVRRAEKPLTITHLALLLVLLAELAVFWAPSAFLHWATAQVIYTAAFASVALLQAGFLVRFWLRKRRSLPLPDLAPLDTTENTPRPSAP